MQGVTEKSLKMILKVSFGILTCIYVFLSYILFVGIEGLVLGTYLGFHGLEKIQR